MKNIQRRISSILSFTWLYICIYIHRIKFGIKWSVSCQISIHHKESLKRFLVSNYVQNPFIKHRNSEEMRNDLPVVRVLRLLTSQCYRNWTHALQWMDANFYSATSTKYLTPKVQLCRVCRGSAESSSILMPLSSESFLEYRFRTIVHPDVTIANRWRHDSTTVYTHSATPLPMISTIVAAVIRPITSPETGESDVLSGAQSVLIHTI